MAHYKGASAEATRAMHLIRKREKAIEELELKKRKLEENTKLGNIDNKFLTHTGTNDGQIKSSSVGLVTLDQLRERQEIASKERDLEIARKQDQSSSSQLMQRKLGEPVEEKKKSLLKNAKSLSFGYDSDEDEDEDENGDGQHEVEQIGVNDKSDEQDANKPTDDDKMCDDKNSQSNPNIDEKSDTKIPQKNQSRLGPLSNLDVDTSLLPDCEREEEERKLREKLAEEWREAQQRLKGEEIEITFSYWDGSGHRRQVIMKKGDSIYQFLQACLEKLRKNFNELRKVSADQLMYVKEDLIIPQHYTFYDLIVTKARGKSGPLFSFDVHDDIRLMGDSRIEKDESHAGKVLLRSWYERNKHIFPASRWEPYDPTKTYDTYTISDKRLKN